MALYLIPKVGQELRDARKKKKQTRLDVALPSGCSRTFISDTEKGILPQRLSTLMELSRIVGADFRMIYAEIQRHLPALRAANHALAREIGEAEASEAHAGQKAS
jgi:transcriptional regulator with XRE-family HTH domain